jgi:hypothetical protein
MDISFDLGTIDWTAISAIGTILAAIATFCAVIVALNTNKPRVEVRSMLNMVHGKQGFVTMSGTVDSVWLIVATNVGRVPVTIKLMGYKLGKTSYLINPDPTMFGNLPIKLDISEDITVWTKMPEEKIFMFKATDLTFAVDSFGKYHYAKVNPIKAVFRFLWWRFGKKFDHNPIEKKSND